MPIQAGREQQVQGSATAKSGLTSREHAEAVSRKSPSAVVVHEALRLEGKEELSRPSSSLLWSGLAAGLTMGFSLIAEGILRAKLPEAPWRELMTSFGYSVGFLFVTLGRQQLFTETTVTTTLPLFHAWKWAGQVVRFWTIVFLANVVGTILFAWGASTPGLFAEEFRSAFRDIGKEALHGGFLIILIRGIVAGWLIALMVWLLPASGSAKFFTVVAVTWLIGVGQLAHVIAGSTEVAYAATVGAVGWSSYLLGFLVPALLGNIIGGVLLVALLNHAQVKEELGESA